MTRVERYKQIERHNNLYIYAKILFGIWVAWFIFVFAYFVPQKCYEPNHINVLLLMCSIFVPLFVAIYIILVMEIIRKQIQFSKKQLIYKREKIRVGIFWDAIKKHE